MIVALLPASPRRRRRLALLTACGIVLALVVVAILALPEPHRLPETFSGRASVDTPGTTHVPAVERRRIDAVVDRFVIAALDRGGLGTAWDLAGPDLRGTTTRADWIAGNTPVAPFPALGRQFHGWTHVIARPNSVTFDLLIQPRPGGRVNGERVGAIAFSVQVIRQHGTWIVNRWYTSATFTPAGTKHPHIVGPNDFGAGPTSTAPNPVNGQGRIARWWLAVPVAIFALGLLTVGIVIGRNWRRYRRMRAALAAESRNDSSRGP